MPSLLRRKGHDLAGEAANVERNYKYEMRKLTKMTRQQEVSNTLLYSILMPTIAAHHLTLANFGLEEKGVQVPHHFLVGSFAFRGRVDGIRRCKMRCGSEGCWLFTGNSCEAELKIQKR